MRSSPDGGDGRGVVATMPSFLPPNAIVAPRPDGRGATLRPETVSALEGGEILQNFVGVGGGILHVVGLADRARRVDQVGMPLREVGIRVRWIACGLVGRTDGAVGVGEERVGEALGLYKLLVVGWRIEADAEDAAVCFCE